MNRSRFTVRLASGLVLLVIAAVSLGMQPAWSQGVVISEFMADNAGYLVDEDGDSPDWIEVYNGGTSAVNLEGWSLTDDKDEPAMWKFPATELGPRAFLIVFASGKDRRIPGGQLHTNFQLDSDGDFLGLSDAGGNAVSFFGPNYPIQVAGASYGLAMKTSSKPLVEAGATARFLVPTGPELALTWVQPDFDDAAWSSGPTGIGFDTRPEPVLLDLIQTSVASVLDKINSSIYVRVPFVVPAGTTPGSLVLAMRYDDGFAAFLNGVEIARRNIDSSATTPATLRYNSKAVKERDDAAAREREEIPIVLEGLLREGTNVLAIQAMSRSTTSDTDFLILPELSILTVDAVETNHRGYFGSPSPSWPNGEVTPRVTPPPTPSVPSGAYKDAFTLDLVPADPESEIRYTLDGLDPKPTSTLYSAPIAVSATTTVKARTFKAGELPSPTVTQTYLLVDQKVLDFTSNLPLVFCSTIATPMGTNCGGGPYTKGQMLVFLPGDDGRTRLTSVPQVADLAAFRRRGSSTCGNAKFSFNVEFKESFDPETKADLRAPDPLGAARSTQVFDFPSDPDYIMFGPYDFDHALMRNPIAYWMSREVGWWAARTQFVECFFINTGRGTPATMTTYFGVYVFMEKNKRGPDRVDIAGLSSRTNAEPEVTGGYLLRRDRVGAGETAISAGGYGSLVLVYPQIPTTAQRSYITSYINGAISSLSPNVGSQEDNDRIDFLGWIDHHILCWYPKNVDAFRLSGYFHKPRNGPMVMGPVWDYDRTMGCADDDRASAPEGWDNTASGDGGTRYFQAGDLGSWYSILFQNQPPTGNSPWARAYRARWRELRAGPLRTENILAQIDAWAAELTEAAPRNFAKWPQTAPRFGGFQGEVNHLKNWLSTRASWIDGQFVPEPVFSPEGGDVSAGTEVALTSDEGEIFYTVNGPDPKATSGSPAPEAILYAGPIQIAENSRIRARTRVNGRVWSILVEGLYVTSRMPVVVSEVMYNAPVFPEDTSTRASDYEYLEILNAGSEPLDIRGLNSTLRIKFDLASTEHPTLAPGEYGVVVDDTTAFRSRYGNTPMVLGEYTGTLGNTSQDVQILGPIGEVLVAFKYVDSWHPTTDGGGHSLVLADPAAPRETWNTKDGWTPSAAIGGSPGRVDGPSTAGRQLPGDLTQDGKLNVTDAISMLLYLQGAVQTPCATDEGTRGLLDVNADEQVNITDAIVVLQYLFLRGPPPALGLACVPLPGCPDACAGVR